MSFYDSIFAFQVRIHLTFCAWSALALMQGQSLPTVIEAR